MRRSLFSQLRRRFVARRSAAERSAVLAQNQARLGERIDAARHDLQALIEVRGAVARRHRVVVVGGGFAGLAAADALLDRATAAMDFEVDLFEASGLLGGRVRSDLWLARGQVVEVGAELIGLSHELWIRLCREFSLGLTWLSPEEQDAGGLDSPVFVGGRRIDKAAQKDLHEEMSQLVDDINGEARTVRDPFRPWIGKLAPIQDAISAASWLEVARGTSRAKLALKADLENTNAKPAEDQSWLANLCLVAGARQSGPGGDFWDNTENARCDRGNDALAHELAQRICDRGGVIHQPTPVEAITIDDAGVVVTASGKEYPCEYVILAVPPTVWHRIHFDGVKVSQGESRLGPAVKHLSVVGSRFWLKNLLTPNTSDGRLGQTWEATENQAALPGRDFVFSIFSGGPAAVSAMKGYADEGDAHFRRKVTAIYAGFDKSFQSAKFCNWPEREEWILGGYSCPEPTEVCSVGKFLSTTPHDRLAFAGEHACMAFFGYMEGALQSGLTAAEKIARLAARAPTEPTPRPRPPGAATASRTPGSPKRQTGPLVPPTVHTRAKKARRT
jgi:monoamine oxidase